MGHKGKCQAGRKILHLDLLGQKGTLPLEKLAVSIQVGERILGIYQ